MQQENEEKLRQLREQIE
jgi:hypothetical protein